MSTKSTIVHGQNFHLYREVLDEDFIYLELEGVPFEASYHRVMVPIPVHIWEVIRNYEGVDLSWSDKTDEEILLYVEQEVDARIKRYEFQLRIGEGDQEEHITPLDVIVATRVWASIPLNMFEQNRTGDSISLNRPFLVTQRSQDQEDVGRSNTRLVIMRVWVFCSVLPGFSVVTMSEPTNSISAFSARYPVR